VNHSPLNDPALLWILGGIVGAIASIYVWIYYHSIRDAKREVRVDELTQEIGHSTIRGSILERLHRYGGRLRRLWERAGMPDEHDQ
jgi:hypothetical protein